MKKFTLPVSQFQSLATIIPEPVSVRNDYCFDVKQFFKFVDYLEEKKDTVKSVHKQFYSLGFLREFRSQLNSDAKVQIFNFIKNFLDNIQEYDPVIWAMPVLSLRVFNMLYTSSLIFEPDDYSEVKKNYFKTILAQSIFLRKKLKKHTSDREYILYIIRSCYAGICFLEERPHLKLMMNLLEQTLDAQFYADGGHVSRNPSFQIKIIEELLHLRTLAVSAGMSLPRNFQTIVSLSSDYINFMRHQDGKFAIFNGGYECDADFIDETLSINFSESKSHKNNRLKQSGYYRISANNLVLIADFYSGQAHPLQAYQGQLSFELSMGKQRIFINCGSGDELGGDWISALKQPLAHTMPVVNIPKLRVSAKDPIFNGKKVTENVMISNNQGFTIEGIQSYEFGKTGHLTHHRQITLFKNSRILRGEDSFCLVSNDQKEPTHNPECFIRFHLAPEIKATSSGTSVILTIPEQGEFMFTVGSGKTVLEPSVYVGTGIPQETKQILVKINLTKSVTKFRWTLQELVKSGKSSQDKASDKVKEDICLSPTETMDTLEKDLQNHDETV